MSWGCPLSPEEYLNPLVVRWRLQLGHPDVGWPACTRPCWVPHSVRQGFCPWQYLTRLPFLGGSAIDSSKDPLSNVKGSQLPLWLSGRTLFLLNCGLLPRMEWWCWWWLLPHQQHRRCLTGCGMYSVSECQKEVGYHTCMVCQGMTQRGVIIHPSFIPAHSLQGRGGWRLSLLSSGKRQGAPWRVTVHQRTHTHTQTTIHTHGQCRVCN